MSCENLLEDYANALTRWMKVDRRLADIALSHVRQPGQRWNPIIPGSEEWNEWGRLLDERDALWQQYRDAENAYREARPGHQLPPDPD